MPRLWMALAICGVSCAWAQAPAYSALNIVNATDYAAGPFAPNSVLAIFGTNLSWSTHALNSGDIAANTVTTQMSGVEVLVYNMPAPLLYVSPGQVNFIVPGNQIRGDNIPVQLVRQGTYGPVVTVALVEASPAIFSLDGEWVLATHSDGSRIGAGAPAHPGETIVLYATGLGQTQPNPKPGEIPLSAAPILWLNNLTIFLDDAALPSFRTKYAGATPGSVGLYQINLELPTEMGSDPAIRVAVLGVSTPSGYKIMVR